MASRRKIDLSPKSMANYIKERSQIVVEVPGMDSICEDYPTADGRPLSKMTLVRRYGSMEGIVATTGLMAHDRKMANFVPGHAPEWLVPMAITKFGRAALLPAIVSPESGNIVPVVETSDILPNLQDRSTEELTQAILDISAEISHRTQTNS